METIVLSLFVTALKTAAILTLPIVVVVAAIGIAVGVVQTLVQVQDQNIAFAPKLIAVAILAAAGAPAALSLLQRLLLAAIQSMVALARA